MLWMITGLPNGKEIHWNLFEQKSYQLAMPSSLTGDQSREDCSGTTPVDSPPAIPPRVVRAHPPVTSPVTGSTTGATHTIIPNSEYGGQRTVAWCPPPSIKSGKQVQYDRRNVLYRNAGLRHPKVWATETHTTRYGESPRLKCSPVHRAWQ